MLKKFGVLIRKTERAGTPTNGNRRDLGEMVCYALFCYAPLICIGVPHLFFDAKRLFPYSSLRRCQNQSHAPSVIEVHPSACSYLRGMFGNRNGERSGPCKRLIFVVRRLQV